MDHDERKLASLMANMSKIPKRADTSAAARERREHEQMAAVRRPARKKTGRTKLLGIRTTDALYDEFVNEAAVRQLLLGELFEEMFKDYRKRQHRKHRGA
jgi:hypothetical protein